MALAEGLKFELACYPLRVAVPTLVSFHLGLETAIQPGRVNQIRNLNYDVRQMVYYTSHSLAKNEYKEIDN